MIFRSLKLATHIITLFNHNDNKRTQLYLSTREKRIALIRKQPIIIYNLTPSNMYFFFREGPRKK